MTSDSAHGATLDLISQLYDGRVGAVWPDDALAEIYKEGEERYAKGVPPGYMDAKEKSGNEKYGDLVLWKQLLKHAAEVKKPVIFVTDDAKEDWWELSGGKTRGPRPELVEEFYNATGERVHLYGVRWFLSQAQERGAKISEKALTEADEVQAPRPRVGFRGSNPGSGFAMSGSGVFLEATHRHLKNTVDGVPAEALARLAAATSSAALSPTVRANLQEITEAAQRLYADHPALSPLYAQAAYDAYLAALRDHQATGVSVDGLPGAVGVQSHDTVESHGDEGEDE